MPSRDIVFRSILAVTLLFTTACQSNGAALVSPGAASLPVNDKKNCGQPDFTIALSPTSATLTIGQSVKVAVTFTSICGFAGDINFGISNISPPPQGGDGFSISQPRYDIPLDANSSNVGYITLGDQLYTLKTTWTITITGKNVQGGCCYGLTHSTTFVLTTQ